MRSRSPPSFAQRLILYGLSLTAPVLALCGALVYQYSVDRYRVIEADVTAAARQLAHDLDGEIDRAVLLLETLVGTLGPEMDLARLHRHASEILVPRGSNVKVHDIAGWPLLNTAVRFGEPLKRSAGHAQLKSIVELNEPLVSDLVIDASLSSPTWIVSTPIRRNGSITAIISISRPADALKSVIGTENRDGWQWTISDRAGLVVVSSDSAASPTGSRMPAALLASSTDLQGIGWVDTNDGTSAIRGYARSSDSGWLASVVIAASVVEAPLRDAWLLFAVGSIVLLTLALALGSSIAHRLHSSVDYLVDAAAKLGHGEPLPKRKFTTREFEQIHNALTEAALERQSSETRRQLLLRELQHRTNNLLAVISSIARRTLLEGRPIKEVRENLMGRLKALANASDTLALAHWQGADIAIVVHNEMRTFAGRYTSSGPPVLLSSQATQNMSLLIHELATNASKHGALSAPNGQVNIVWQIEGDGAEARLRFDWIERGGPPAQPPQRRGFGYTLLETVLSDLNRKPEMRFDPEGLSYSTTIRLNSVVAAGAPSAPDERGQNIATQGRTDT